RRTTLDYGDCARTVKRIRDGEDAFLAALAAPTFEPREFTAFLLKERLVLRFEPILSRDGAKGILPVESLEELRVVAEAGRARAHTLLPEALEIRAALERATVPALWLKGLTFADRLYGGIDRRYQRDHDLLVHEKDVE